jgi:hypothetical protein
MKPSRLLLLLPFIALCAAALGQFGQGTTWGRANMIDWGTFKSGTTSKFLDPQMLVLNTENDFIAYWPRATGNSALSAPQGLDWNKYKLVAIHIGSRATSGYSVYVQNIVRDGAFATIHAVEATPLRNQYVAKVQTSPWVIVKVERNAVEFKLSLTSKQAQPSIILGPGGAYIGPKDNDGAGWVDPRLQADWGTYRQGATSRINDPQMLVLNTESEFIQYYERTFGGRAPRAGIDWYRYRLVAIHLGVRPTTGYAVSVRNVIRNGVYGTIRAVEETPIPGQYVSRVETSPFVIVKVERNLVQFSLDISAKQAKDGIVITGDGRRHGGR